MNWPAPPATHAAAARSAATTLTGTRPAAAAKRAGLPTFQLRVRVLAACFALGFGVIAARLVQLQLVNGAYYREQARTGGGVQRLDAAPRGAIGDRLGNPLARDLPSYDLAVRADRLPFENTGYKDLSALREKLQARAEAEKRALSPADRQLLDAALEEIRGRALREPWVRRLAQTIQADETVIAAGIADACDRIARKWAMASAPVTILRGIDPNAWTMLSVLQEDKFRNPGPPKRGAPAASIAVPLEGAPEREEPAFPGLVCVHSVRRAYLHGSLASHVLGVLGELQPEQLDCLREQGVLTDHLEERRAIWTRQRERLTAAQAAELATVLGADPRELRGLGELLGALQALDPARRRRAAELGLADAVRWIDRPPRMELCEAERIALGAGQSRQDGRPRGRLVDLRLGLTGVEAWYNDLLRGRHGFETFGGQDAARLNPEALPREGRMLALTLNPAWQRACERALASQPRPAAMVVLDCHTGEVLAMASFPDFDPNLFSPPREGKERQAALKAVLQDPRKPLTNRCIGEQYPLGSVFKPFVAAVALEQGLVRPGERFECRGWVQEGQTRFHCDGRRAHGSVDLREALRRSCNVCFYHLGARLGVEGLAPWAKAAGLGRRTGLDLPGEASGIYPDRAWRERRFPNSTWDRAWSRGKDYHLAIGQGYMSVTPLQAACLMASIANGGLAVTPRLWLDAFAPEPQPLGLSPAALAVVREGLDEAVNVGTPGARGTAYAPFHAGERLAVRVAGKTGTADTGRENEAPHAWFGGYAPAQNPRVAFVVLVENGGHGGEVAAPLAYQALKEIYGTAGGQ